jgi:hypothetical protein
MKKTLYQILGVDPKASKSEIEAAYSARIDELKFATLQDPNKLRVLQQSKDILSDPNQRATYDASISLGGAPEPAWEPRAVEPSFLGRWGRWIAAGVLLIVAGIWWARHGSAPPLPPARQVPVPAASTPASPAQVLPIETAALPAPKDAPANAPLVPAPAAETPTSPLAGVWSCEDALTGHTSKYTFQQDGSLTMATSNGQLLDFKYELEGTALKVTDSAAARVFSVEELAARKMILNLGGAGQRVVCKR